MDNQERVLKLSQLYDARDNVMNLANSLAGDEYGHLAAALQHSKNIIQRVICQLNGEDEPERLTLPLVDINPEERNMIRMVDDIR